MGLCDKALRNGFRKLGHNVAKYPKYFILSSIIVASILTTGLLQLDFDDDTLRLFSNAKGNSVYELAQIQKYFPANYSGAFSPSRKPDIGGSTRIIITVKDGGNIFRSDIWKEITELDNIIHKVQVSYGDISYNYSTLCARVKANCWENDHLDLGQLIDRIENGSLRLAYPIMVNPKTYNTHVLKFHFAELTISDDKLTLLSAEAMNLNYFVKFESDDDKQNSIAWENGVTDALDRMVNNWTFINVYRMNYYTAVTEQTQNTLNVIPYLAITVFLMCCFTVSTTLSRDWVRAKPWVAMFGICIAGLGSVPGLGLLCYVGVPCIGINLAVPFIMLGIGLDDTFVMLSSWRQTNSMDAVEKRLAEAYAEAAVSITITSLTDMLSFYVGLLTPIPSIQIFCAYAGTSVFCMYMLQIFCLGPILGLSGHQEADNRHSVFWWMQVLPKSRAGKESTLYNLFFTGGINKDDPKNALDSGENAVMIFFRDRFAEFIAKGWVQAIVLIAFVVYLGIATFGFMHFTEGIKEEHLYHDDSYASLYHRTEDKYFKRYFFRMQIAITTPLDYSSNKTQSRVIEILNALTNSSEYASSSYGENWLSSYKSYILQSAENVKRNITEQKFIEILRTEYLPNNIFEQDVIFDANKTRIIASRFIMQLVDIAKTEDLTEALTALRHVAAAQKDVEVLVFNPWAGLIVDQFTIIPQISIQLLSIAAAIVMVVAILLIPNLVTSICVLFTIVSTEWGVFGLMALWGVSLDMISILCLVMCIGFSVDFSAHISYAYISSEGTPKQRIKKALFSLGLPILQGGGSTIIGVFSFVFISSYIFQVFFKVVFLVILCAAWHGLLVLPVLLLLIKPESIGNKMCGKQQTFKVEN